MGVLGAGVSDKKDYHKSFGPPHLQNRIIQAILQDLGSQWRVLFTEVSQSEGFSLSNTQVCVRHMEAMTRFLKSVCWGCWGDKRLEVNSQWGKVVAGRRKKIKSLLVHCSQLRAAPFSGEYLQTRWHLLTQEVKPSQNFLIVNDPLIGGTKSQAFGLSEGTTLQCSSYSRALICG